VNKRIFIAVSIIVLFAILIFLIPSLLGKKITPILPISAIVMVSIYVVLSFEILHRTSIALLGATILIAASISLQTITPQKSLNFITEIIDFNTIGLLLGMMIIVAVLGETGVFNWVAVKATELSKGNPWRLMLILCAFTAGVSMFVNNVTIILLMVPVTLTIFKFLNRSPLPYLIGQCLCSNIGGAATLIGDPPNIIIGSAANISFDAFLLGIGPTIGITFIGSLFLLRIFFAKEFTVNFDVKELAKIWGIRENPLVKDKALLMKSLIILVGIIFLFTIQGFLGVDVSIIALGGAAILLVVTRLNVEKVLHEVDWSTLLFFTGLFIVIGIVRQAGGIEILSSAVLNITHGDPWSALISTVWLSAIGSAFVDNIPLTVTMVPLLETLTKHPNIISIFGHLPVNPLWWALSLGANLGGNGTLIGSSVGVVAAGISAKYGNPLTFNKWFKIGFPFMIITVALGMSLLIIFTILAKS
jgi:Na+/H+ antiporter NhaD/arsenite permease-like protein